jgi:xanthine dehydrogenase YagR molybdenum-binding subunit
MEVAAIMRINGRPERLQVDSRVTLLDALRDRLGLTGTKKVGDYLVPVNADVPELEVMFVGEPDRFNPIGVKGIGEVSLVGMAAAIANAVFHATGRRIRSLPITLDRLL